MRRFRNHLNKPSPMNNIILIAKNTFRQTIRDKVLYGIVVFCFLFLGSTVVLNSLSLGEGIFVIRNFGIAGIYVFGLVITIFLGASAIYEDVERKVTYLILAKPATKADMIIGKFIGLLSGIGLTILLMTLAYLAVVFYSGGGMDYRIFAVIGLQVMEMGILTALLILFSIFTTPLAATIYTILILYIGHLLSLIKAYAIDSGLITKAVLTSVYYLMPNLEKFNIRNLAVHDISVSAGEISASAIYALMYVSVVLYAAKIIFNKKDL